ncbi:phytoene synthase [Caulobacter ginsengisoli]|uniref:Phytoene synthase n=1 Tax=Caulobacter ginsengisoli TaxID=400775 RepID=A0ABU0IP90_9CAUL|nr:squalene/phytoene synthase family protein [Caulobacter ginsengisoli]MDQ0463821.1 phytoene synthase [Caulobacter ginsengisoli]
MDDLEDIDAIVRRADPDRWLASRFVADPAARADVLALYAFNQELARIPFAVSDPLMGEIRLTWWREAMDEIALGRPPRRHPVVLAVAASSLPPQALADLTEARDADLETEPFADREAVLAYLDATVGAVTALAARRLDPASDAAHVVSAARAYGLAALWRLKQTGHRCRLPQAWSGQDIRLEVDGALAAARAEVGPLPVAAFPAVAPAALARASMAGEPGALVKRLRLTLAVATGRLG